MFWGRVQENSQFLELQAPQSNSLSPQVPWIFPAVPTGDILLGWSCVCLALQAVELSIPHQSFIYTDLSTLSTQHTVTGP